MATLPKPKPTPSGDAADASKSALDKAAAALAGVNLGGVDPTDKTQSPVWWAPPNKPTKGMRKSDADQSSLHSGDTFISKDAAYRKVWEWYGTPEFDKWGDYLVELGVLTDADRGDPNRLAQEWYDAVDTSANLTAAGKKVSPREAMRLISGAKKTAASTSKAGTQTATTRSVNLTDPETAKSLVNDVLSRQLGRAARPEEIAAFTQVLHSAQQANPSISTETRTYDEAGNYTSQTQTSGGLDAAGAQQVLSDKAMRSPEYGALQAATTYYNAFTNAIQSPVPG